MNSEWKDGHVCLPHSSALDIRVHDKNKDIVLGKANKKKIKQQLKRAICPPILGRNRTTNNC